MSDPIGEAVRENRRRELLGDSAACVVCGFSNLRLLVATDRSMVEGHHLVGRLRDDQLVVPLCPNHHRMITEENRDQDIPMRPGPNFLEELAVVLRCAGNFLIHLGEALLEFSADLLDQVDDLDRSNISWRPVLENQRQSEELDE